MTHHPEKVIKVSQNKQHSTYLRHNLKEHHLPNVSWLARHVSTSYNLEIAFVVDILFRHDEFEITFLIDFFFSLYKYIFESVSAILFTVSLEMRALGEKRLRIGWRPSQMRSFWPNEGRQNPPAKLTWANDATTSSWQITSRNLYSELMSVRMVAKSSSTTLKIIITNKTSDWTVQGELLHQQN